MTGRFDRYFLGQLTLLFGFFALVLVLVYWVNRAVVLFDQLIANGQSATVFLEFSALSLPNVIRIVLPIAAFAGTVYVTNRLTSESELVVVQATGFSPWRLVRPVFVFGVLVFLLASLLAHILVPASLSRLAVRTAEISENMTARLLTEGQFLHPAEGVTFYIRNITANGELQNVFLSDARDPDISTTYSARTAYLLRGDDSPTLVMRDGMAQRLDNDTRQLATTRFDDFAFNLAGLIETPDSAARRSTEFGTPALFRADPVVQALTGDTRDELIAEAHDRIVGALNSLVAALVGFAALLVGGFSRFGIWRQIVAAIVCLIIIQSLSTFGQDVVRSNAASWPMAYIGVVFGLVVTAVCLFLASRPGLLRRRVRKVAAS